MVQKICKKCSAISETTETKCPHCGASYKKGFGCLGWTIIVLGGLIGLSIIGNALKTGNNSASSNTPAKATAEKQKQEYKMGETINIGYTSYAVWKAWFSSRLSDNEYLDEKPDALYLFVDLTVRNDDKKARTIPPFKLIDENGAEYETTSKAFAVEGALGMLDSLNPGVEKRGFIVFDVPKDHTYKLEISGGYWSGEKTFVEIKTK